MKKTYCDICDKEIRGEDNRSTIYIKERDAYSGEILFSEVCSTCTRKVIDFINEITEHRREKK